MPWLMHKLLLSTRKLVRGSSYKTCDEILLCASFSSALFSGKKSPRIQKSGRLFGKGWKATKRNFYSRVFLMPLTKIMNSEYSLDFVNKNT